MTVNLTIERLSGVISECLPVAFMFALLLYFRLLGSRQTETRDPIFDKRRIIEHIEHARSIADFTAFNARALEERLELRAKPNARLVRAFDLNNSFTTTSKDVHARFLKRARGAIKKGTNGDWQDFGDAVRKALASAEEYFQKEAPYLPLACVVRTVSFSLVLRVLFDVEPSEIDVKDARIATEAINRLWSQSKECGSEPSPYNKKLLSNALRRLLPGQYSIEDDELNPLNLIMPAYETLWRVVLLIFVSITGRGVDPATSEELRQAIENVPECLNKSDEAERRALAIAKEGLRLYPPTRRIHRATLNTDGEEVAAAADVEACHRYTEIWGPDAHRFLPSRFHDWARKKKDTDNEPSTGSMVTEVPEYQVLSYFPFGVGKHVCPAATGFGERLITLLVVELARRFGTSERTGVVHYGKRISQQCGLGLLPTGRHDMESWVLEVRGEEED
ncbi:hypothetical protein F5Y17DRAFT_296833 [Xylariaceae sp. FL0594]|nr:hypothetical protein F5Y17DRAFT_296833 [Xylariaceae sp. FL0594]